MRRRTFIIFTMIVFGLMASHATSADAKSGVSIKDSAFLVLHFQNGVAHPDGVWGKKLYPQVVKNGSIGNTKKALEAARDKGMLVIYVNIAWRPGFPELPEDTCALLREAKEKNKCLRGSWGAEVIKELKPKENEIIVINFGSDGFEGTDLDLILRANKINHIYVTGQCTEHVVATTVKRAVNMGYTATVLKDCTSGFTDQNYEAMLKILPLYGELITSSEFISSL
jgi:nicotinamidase-related amidase